MREHLAKGCSLEAGLESVQRDDRSDARSALIEQNRLFELEVINHERAEKLVLPDDELD